MLYHLVLSLPGLSCLFWAVVIGLRYKENSLPQHLWVVTALVMAVSTSIWGIFFSGVTNYELFYKLEAIEAFTTLLLPSLLYFCYRSFTNEKPFGWKMYVWMAPAFAIGGAITVIYLSMGREQAVEYLQATILNQGSPSGLTGKEQVMAFISGPVYSVLVFLQMIIVLLYGAFRLIHYRERLNDFYSNLEGKSIEHYRALLTSGCLMLVLSLASYRGRFYYNEQSLFLAIHMAGWAVLISFMGYNVYKLRFTAQSLADELEHADREADEQHYDTSPFVQPVTKLNGEINNKKYRELLSVFEKLMNDERIFLQFDLRLDDVAARMHTNRTYISRMINEEFGVSFSDCINSRRISYAQELMRMNTRLTQSQIAEMSGFTSPSAFSRMFRLQAGITFSEWRKMNL